MSELKRLIDLVPYLKAHNGVGVAEVAEAFGTTRERILADLSILQFVGLPGGYYGDLFDVDIDGARLDGHIFASNVDALGRPMRLTQDQVASLTVALRVVMELGGDDDAARSALAKLERLALDANVYVDVDVEAGEKEDRALLAAAVAEHRAVRLRYRPGGRGEPREATVDPARLRTDAGYVYLDAWSRERGAWRSFRLDRVEGAQLLDGRFEPREIPSSLDSWFDEAPRRLTIVVTPQGRWCADYFPTSGVRDVADGTEITFPLVSEEWGARLILRLGDALVRCEDDETLAAARAMAASALEHYEGRG